MPLTIHAAAAILAALVEFTVAPYVAIGQATPHPLLVLAVVASIAAGFEAGVVWAFVGGVTLDVVAQRPVGSSAFSLLFAVAVGAAVGVLLARVRVISPVAATLPASAVYGLLLLVTTTALAARAAPRLPLGGLVPSAAYDALLAALVGPLVVAVVARRSAVERATW